MNAIRLDSAASHELAYALSKHIPSMARGFSIHTSYGEIEIDEADAKPFAAALERKLQTRLRREDKRAGV